MKRLVPIVVLFALSSACTTTDEIIIDKKGVDMSRYDQDLSECKAYATEVQTGKKVAKGAASGAVVGGLRSPAMPARRLALARLAGEPGARAKVTRTR